jgi:hypothetical protein
MQRRMTKRVALDFVALLTLLVAGVAGVHAADRDLNSEYKKLSELEFKMIDRDPTSAEKAQMREFRDHFVEAGSPGAHFLIAKLNAMTADDKEFFTKATGPVDEEVEPYLRRWRYAGKSYELKYAVIFILADLYPRTDADTQAAILKAIVASYTPPTWGDKRMEAALERIGRPGIAALLEVANELDAPVRCGAADALAELGKAAAKQGLPAAPGLDCNAYPADRLAQLQQWHAWWDKYGAQVTLPEAASPFDAAQ